MCSTTMAKRGLRTQGKRIIKNAVSGTHCNLVSYQFPGQVTQVGMGLFLLALLGSRCKIFRVSYSEL
jgi:hypothetical protein